MAQRRTSHTFDVDLMGFRTCIRSRTDTNVIVGFRSRSTQPTSYFHIHTAGIPLRHGKCRFGSFKEDRRDWDTSPTSYYALLIRCVVCGQGTPTRSEQVIEECFLCRRGFNLLQCHSSVKTDIPILIFQLGNKSRNCGFSTCAQFR